MENTKKIDVNTIPEGWNKVRVCKPLGNRHGIIDIFDEKGRKRRTILTILTRYNGRLSREEIEQCVIVKPRYKVCEREINQDIEFVVVDHDGKVVFCAGILKANCRKWNGQDRMSERRLIKAGLEEWIQKNIPKYRDVDEYWD